MHRIALNICLVAITFYLSGCVESLKIKSYAPKPDKGVNISGVIIKPDGDGPFPGIIILHGCGGIMSNDYDWAHRFKKWGYASLVLDSNGPRGLNENCGKRKKLTAYERALDAHAAKVKFGSLPYVDRKRIGILGNSHGAWTVLEANRFNLVEYTLPEEARDPFKAAVALYPYCRYKYDSNTNLLILSGGKDDWTPSRLCEENLPEAHSPENVVILKIYPGAYHKFDNRKGHRTFNGHQLAYSPSAMTDAVPRVKAFFDKYVKGQ